LAGLLVASAPRNHLRIAVEDDMLRIAIVIGSTRAGRKGVDVARWVMAHAESRRDAAYEIVDIAEFDLALLGESESAGAMEARWPDTIARFDGYVLVTPEYNHAPSAALKNALDLGGPAWANKAVAFVGYGGFGGIRAVEVLRLVVANLELAAVKPQVALTLNSDFSAEGVLLPRAHQGEAVGETLDRLVAWAGAMREVRALSDQKAA
jgi:NAD(P)H-dependent FMN reductase